jgi:hypothetical protein
VLTVKVHGIQQSKKALNGFSKGVRERVTRNAVSKGAGVLRDHARTITPKETGLLKRNLIVKLMKPKRGNAYIAKVGAKRGVKAAVRRTGKGAIRAMSAKKSAAAMAGGATLKWRSPSRYAHLAEKQTPFLGPTVRAKGGAAIEAHNQKLSQGIEEERKKALSKSVKV